MKSRYKHLIFLVFFVKLAQADLKLVHNDGTIRSVENPDKCVLNGEDKRVKIGYCEKNMYENNNLNLEGGVRPIM